MTPRLKAVPTPSEQAGDPQEPTGDPFTRDLIAIVAMHALLNRERPLLTFEEITNRAYSMADAFLKEMDKP